MAGYIGKSQGVTQVDGYNRSEADTRYVNTTGDTMTGNLVTPMVVADSALANRNKVINGNFGINQRVVSGTVTLSAGAYGHDRWKAGASGCTYTFATSANVTTITISAGSLVQVIEGLNLQSGTHVLSWTGTVQMTIDGGSAGSSGMTGTLTGGTNATIETSGTGTLSLVQLEAGDAATPFEHRSFGQELALCERYYEVGQAEISMAVGPNGASQIVIPYRQMKRATPTVTLTNAFSLGGGSSVGALCPYKAGSQSALFAWTSSAEL